MVDAITAIHEIGDPCFLSVFYGPDLRKGPSYRFTVGDEISHLKKKHKNDNLCIPLQPLVHNMPDDVTDPSKEYVYGYRWMLVDVDAKREKDPVTGIKPPATDEQRDAALEITNQIAEFMLDLDFGFPLVSSSGNGVHSLYRVGQELLRKRMGVMEHKGWIPLGADMENYISWCLKFLSMKFSNELAGVDESVYNLARLWRLPDTLNVKAGQLARFLYVENDPVPADENAIKALASMWTLPRVLSKSGDIKNIEGGVPAVLAEAGIEIKREKPYGVRGKLWELAVCPANPSHTRGEAFVVQEDDGRVWGKCHHDTCGWTWREEYRKIRPQESKSDLAWLLEYPMNDVGNAERLVRMFGDDMRYIIGQGWCVFNDDLGVWQDDNGLKAQAKGKALAKKMLEASVLIYDEDMKKAWAKWCKQSNSKNGIKAFLELARDDLSCDVSIFDRHVNKLCCLDGMIDLDTGALYEKGRHWYARHFVNEHYDTSATCPLWENFIEACFPQDKYWEMPDFIHKMFGYIATGKKGLELLICFFGFGANGKTEMLRVIRGGLNGPDNPMGYAGVIKFGSFTASRTGNAHTSDLMHVPGLRLLTTGEGSRDDGVNEGEVKAFTSEPTLRLRAPHANEIEVENHATGIIASNRKLKVRGQDHGIWRRLALVPFEAEFDKPPHVRIDKYGLVILAQDGYAGILNWIVQGAVKYNQNGLDLPRLVREQTEVWQHDEDNTSRVFEACFEVTRKRSDRITDDDAYRAYRETCEMMGIDKQHIPSSSTFADILVGKKIKTESVWDKTLKKNIRKRIGLKLRGVNV